MAKKQGDYDVVNPHNLYLGKSYSDWAADWFNWNLSAHADKRNSGPVVFLRSQGLPNSRTGILPDEPTGITATGTDTLPEGHGLYSDYPWIYVNDPNIRISNDRLQIYEDQAVFFPMLTAYQFASIVPYRDWGYLQDYTGSIIDNGDNPPERKQLSINNIDIDLPRGLEMNEFRVATPIFTAVVPEAPYGTSIKDFLDDGPIAPGTYPALVDGYWFMLKFKEPNTYYVHSWASAGREPKGPYFSELLYEIEVLKRAEREPHGRITSRRPARNEGVINRILTEKKKIGELTEADVNRIKLIPDRVKKILNG
jgi:hypothetical protein